jgi:hypothetical protein
VYGIGSVEITWLGSPLDRVSLPLKAPEAVRLNTIVTHSKKPAINGKFLGRVDGCFAEHVFSEVIHSWYGWVRLLKSCCGLLAVADLSTLTDHIITGCLVVEHAF